MLAGALSVKTLFYLAHADPSASLLPQSDKVFDPIEA
jgi:hypothetical protein